jgi:hypothetical protein
VSGAWKVFGRPTFQEWSLRVCGGVLIGFPQGAKGEVVVVLDGNIPLFAVS